MKKLLLALMPCIVILILSGFSQASSAATLSGTVILNGHAASAAVVAIPYDPKTHQTIEGRAVVVPTDAQGKFHLTIPSEHYLVAAWDGHNGTVVDSPINTVTLIMTDQAPPQYQTASDCKWHCSCTHFIGNLYWVFLWADGVFCGSYQYLSWGCHC